MESAGETIVSPIQEDFHKSLACYCFSNLEHFLTHKKMQDYASNLDSQQHPLFVTYYLDGRLRSCIGTFKPDMLGKTLQSYSIIAALKDHRFPPVQLKEVPHLTCEVSILSQFEQIAHPLDWEVGKHGIEIEFSGEDDGETYRGTYLPQVAKEQGWDQRSTLESLLKKAGYYGGDLESVSGRFKMVRRQASIKSQPSKCDLSNFSII
ncbi:hypothetical protein FGO68_gene11976 [Halteria grandinella]|uniref:AMMECR1 domain-containing protein n=1 Tax=Halteria grandinella TaxID=5974 RepID=A0A8J8NIZ2_HALGN|nr:hypothetical protein FGO68_gene11976 [Halteria grandinella]